MHILYYITSHGFGHAVRSAAVCNSFSSGVRVTFRTDIPLSFFKEELRIPFSVIPGAFDCGCIQRDGITVDIDGTLRTYCSIAEKNEKQWGREVQMCKDLHVDCIVSDIAPFAFDVAAGASLPSVALTNFTWYDIYKEYAEEKRWFLTELRKMRAQYSRATLLLSLYPGLEMNFFPNSKKTPVAGRTGENRRDEIAAHFKFNRGIKIALIYTGNYGLSRVEWEKLERFEQWEFIGVYPLKGAPANFHLVTKNLFPYQDLSASVDLIAGKLGYGVFSESIVNNVPLIFLPRTDFAEYSVLRDEIIRCGLGQEISEEDFLSLQWKDAIERSTAKRNKLQIPCDGALFCAREIENLAASN